MNWQDWQVTERLTRIRRSYQTHGLACDVLQHYITADLGTVGSHTVGTPVIVKAPPDSTYAIFGQMIGIQASDTPADEQLRPEFTNVLVLEQVSQDSRILARHEITGILAGAPISARGWQPAANLFGLGEHPFFFAFPLMLQRNNTLSLQVYNASTSSYAVRVTFLGFKLYVREAAA